MRYKEDTFTLPTNQAQMSQEEYEIRVGVRCPACRKKREDAQMPPALNLYSHPAECQLCHGTFIEWLHKREPDGYTFGFRFCSNLKTANGTTPATTVPTEPDAICSRRHMLPGMNNKVLSEGGAP